MQEIQEGYQLRIIIGEAVQHDGMQLYEWIVHTARAQGVAGATVTRGIMGYGTDTKIKTASLLRLSEDLPVSIELFDNKIVLEQFLDQIAPVLREGLTTLTPMVIQRHHHAPNNG